VINLTRQLMRFQN